MTPAAKKGGISLDMTKAQTMDNMPDNTRVLVAISDWKTRQSSGGNETLHVEATVVKPETSGTKNRKLFDDINLSNEFTLGRLLTILKGLGYKEDDIRKKDFTLPEKDDVVGMQMTVIVGIRKDETGVYGDRNTMKRILPASAFESAAY